VATKHIYVSGDNCFMRHPICIRTHWIKTDRCVAFVSCDACDAERGELCQGTGGPIAATHHVRRKVYAAQKTRLDVSPGTTLHITVEG
jgi:hypothetical protein